MFKIVIILECEADIVEIINVETSVPHSGFIVLGFVFDSEGLHIKMKKKNWSSWIVVREYSCNKNQYREWNYFVYTQTSTRIHG